MGLLITAQSMNTFFVVFHMFDTEDSDEKLRYKLGNFAFMTFFFLQTGMLIGTWIYAFVIYYRLAKFLKPPAVQYNENGEEIGDDDVFEN